MKPARKRTTLTALRVLPSPLDRRRGRLVAGSLVVPCALGRSGVTRDKREGDGASPAGSFRVIQAFYRPGGLFRGTLRPRTRLPLRPIRPADGWCDDPRHRLYNRPVRLPFEASHERMWREDGLYDLVLDLAWNRGPIRRGRGSAIFLHLARAGIPPTEGCVALPRDKVRRVVERIGPGTRVVIGG